MNIPSGGFACTRWERLLVRPALKLAADFLVSIERSTIVNLRAKLEVCKRQFVL